VDAVRLHVRVGTESSGLIHILLTAIMLPPCGSSTVHIYTQKIHVTTQNKHYIEQHKNVVKVQAVLHLCELYPGICISTEEKHGKTSVRVAEECQLAR